MCESRRKPLEALPPEIDEGQFAFFTREEIDSIAIPPTDRVLVWPVFDKHAAAGTFLAYRAQCGSGEAVRVDEEAIG